jgi:hypothetical protein
MYSEFIRTMNPYRHGGRPNVTKKPFSIGYYGSQSRFANEILKLVPEGASRYVDLVAGGMGVPYAFARTRNKPVAVNDASYFSHAWGMSVFKDDFTRTLTDEKIRELLDVTPVEGYITNHTKFANISNGGAIPENIAKYLDGLLQTHHDKHVVAAAIGKLLATEFAFRQLRFCSTSAEGISIKKYPIETVITKLYRIIDEARIYNQGLSEEVLVQNIVSWDDASNFVQRSDFPNMCEGAFVYMDPAWPWNPAAGSNVENPYFFTSVLLPEWLLQTSDTDMSLRIWPNDDADFILNDIYTWVSAALNAGALRVVVNTQSTNFPEPSIVEDFLRAHFSVTSATASLQYSSTAKTSSFGEYMYCIDSIKR